MVVFSLLGIFMSITAFLRSNGFQTFEGHCQEVPKQVFDLIRLTKSPVTKIMEVGFNAGHSSEIFLRHNPKISVVSFDIGTHPYVNAAKQYIDQCYSNRHTLILGNSKDSLPQYVEANPGVTFDLIFLDGGSSYEEVKSDLENSRKLANKDTIVVVDDTYWTESSGPLKAWNECIQKGEAVEMDRKTYTVGRAMNFGKFIL